MTQELIDLILFKLSSSSSLPSLKLISLITSSTVKHLSNICSNSCTKLSLLNELSL